MVNSPAEQVVKEVETWPARLPALSKDNLDKEKDKAIKYELIACFAIDI